MSRWWLASAAMAVAACGSPRLASREEVAAAERRLDAPFLEQRGVLGDELVIEVSPNFDRAVVRPAVHRDLHGLELEKGEDRDEYRWSNNGGGMEMPLRFSIGGTEFAILHRATLRVLRRGPMQLSSVVTGNVLVDERGALTRAQEFRIEDGAVRAR
jgi:hypothetical protein